MWEGSTLHSLGEPSRSRFICFPCRGSCAYADSQNICFATEFSGICLCHSQSCLCPNTDEQVTSRPQGDPSPLTSELRSSLLSSLCSCFHSTSCALGPYSHRPEVLTALGRKAPGLCKGLLFKPVAPMRLSSLMKQLPPPSPKPELSLLENSQPSGKLEGKGMEKGRG